MATESRQSGVRCTCGVIYRWLPEQAGCLVHCWCGRRWRLPATAPDGVDFVSPIPPKASEEASGEILRPCPMCRTLKPQSTDVCVQCGYNSTAGQFVRPETDADVEPSRPTVRERYRRLGLDAFKSREIPVAMLVISLFAIFLGLGTWELRYLFPALLGLILWCTIGIGWMLASTEMFSFFTHIELGSLRFRLLICSAIYAGLIALRIWAGYMQEDFAGIVLWVVRPFYYLGFLGFFFDLELFYAVLLVALVLIFDITVSLTILPAFLAGF